MTSNIMIWILVWADGKVARLRFKEGTPVAGLACATDTWYLELLTNRRVVMAQTMTLNGGCISAALVTIELEAVDD